MKDINTFWIPEGGNWGDNFSEFLFREKFGINLIRADYNQPFDLVCCGSLIRDLPNLYHSDPDFRSLPPYNRHVLGAGLMDWLHDDKFDLSQAQVHLLRGRWTLEHCEVSQTPLLGDPGILAYLFAKPQPKTYELGIIPHYVERDRRQIQYWSKKGPHINIIDIQSGIQNVIDEVSKCKAIVSSALHGLVIADSLGIPNHIVVLHENWVWNRGFKFNDYYSVYGEEADPCRSIDEAYELCKTRDTSKIKMNVLQACNNFVQAIKTEL